MGYPPEVLAGDSTAEGLREMKMSTPLFQNADT